MGDVLTMVMLAGCMICYVFQGLFGKLYAAAYDGQESDATPVYSCLYGVIVSVSVFAAAMGFRFSASAGTWALGVLNGLMLFLYNLGVIKASLTGPFSIQSIFRLFGGVVVPMAFSVLFWQDALSAVQAAGIVLMLVSFVVINADGAAFKGIRKGYIGWVALLFTVNGAYGTLMACQQRLTGAAESNEMIVITFLSSAVISLISLAFTRKGGTLKAFRMSKKALLYAVGAGVVAALAVVQLMLLLGRMESLSVFYTVENGMVLVLTVLFSALMFKEKLSRNAIAGIALAVISLAMLSM